MKISKFVGFGFVCISSLLAYAQAGPARPAITGISHLSVYSADEAKTEYFYVHDLGAVKMTDPENPQGVRYYFGPTQFIEVLPLPAGETSINRLDHMAYRTADVEALRRYLEAHSVTVPGKAERGSDGSSWFDVMDPEGNKVEFVQAPTKPVSIPINPLSSHIIHIGFMAHRQEVEDAFYRTILGFRPYWFGGGKEGVKSWISQQVPDGTDWVEYMMASGPETRGIPATMSRAGLGSMDHFSLGVDNIEKTTELLYAGDRLTGRNLNAGPKIGRDGKWQLNLFDPDETRAEIMEFQPKVKPCCSPFTAESPIKK
ncbi:VOC family protein [Granulicella sp. WH15]|nr:VOC family protein [Granulicella sp. WH15]